MNRFPSSQEFFDEVFEEIEARDQEYKDIEFQNCRFVRCSLSSARFLRCRFLDCEFEQCDLSNILVKNASFRGNRFAQCKMIGINWTESSIFTQIVMVDCVLNFSLFNGLDLRRIEITDSIAHELDFTETKLTEANCRGTDFKGSRFFKSNLTKADFRGAKQYAIHPVDNLLKQTRMSLPEATSLLYQLDIILED